MNPLLETCDFDSDARSPMVLCVVPSSGDPVRFAMPAIYLELARLFDGQRTPEQAIDAFLKRHPAQFERSWLGRLVEQSLLPKGLLVHSHQDPSCVGTSTQPKRAFLHIKLPIIPSPVVDTVAARLSFMFHPKILLFGLALFFLSHGYVYGALIRRQDVDFNQLDAGSILLIMLFSTLATICHEFGHASAAAHYGCRKMTIGWGVYIIYTVLWTNVSEAWKLPRKQRAVVDIGGVYFESLFMLVLLGTYIATENNVYLFAFVFIDLSIITTLNPFLRMDGYWLVSDLFGIVNLRKQQSDWFEEILSKLFGRPSVRKANLNERAKWVLGIYSIAGVTFMAYLMTVLFQIVVFDVAAALPGRIVQFGNDVEAGTALLELLSAALEIFWRMLMLFGATIMIVRFLKKIANMVARIVPLKAVTQPRMTGQ